MKNSRMLSWWLRWERLENRKRAKRLARVIISFLPRCTGSRHALHKGHGSSFSRNVRKKEKKERQSGNQLQMHAQVRPGIRECAMIYLHYLGRYFISKETQINISFSPSLIERCFAIVFFHRQIKKEKRNEGNILCATLLIEDWGHRGCMCLLRPLKEKNGVCPCCFFIRKGWMERLPAAGCASHRGW